MIKDKNWSFFQVRANYNSITPGITVNYFILLHPIRQQRWTQPLEMRLAKDGASTSVNLWSVNDWCGYSLGHLMTTITAHVRTLDHIFRILSYHDWTLMSLSSNTAYCWSLKSHLKGKICFKFQPCNSALASTALLLPYHSCTALYHDKCLQFVFILILKGWSNWTVSYNCYCILYFFH